MDIESGDNMIKHYKRKMYTPAQFKATFKVGDEICGWSTGKTVKISVMGETRFLSWFRGDEIVNTMSQAQGWVLVKGADVPECEPESTQ